MIPDCVHRGQVLEDRVTPKGCPDSIWRCAIHRKVDTKRCVSCTDYLDPTQPVETPASCDQPTNVLVNEHGHAVNLAGVFRGCAAFFLLGGPSAKQLNLEMLSHRGVLLFSTNNTSAMLPPAIRPTICMHSDKPRKFGDWQWLDPAVLNLTPVTMWRHNFKGQVRRKIGPGQFEDRGITANECPNVLAFQRNHNFRPEAYLWEPTINNGNDEKHACATKDGKPIKFAEPNGYPHCINTMFCALRLPFYFGVRRLYLLGCDFTMDPKQPYGFGQGKHAGGCRTNDNSYSQMIYMFEALLPYFERAGYEVYNCNPESHCYVFPFVDFEEAIKKETQHIPQGVVDASEWYDE